jgi:thiamine-phosphate pyrophosphorylase
MMRKYIDRLHYLTQDDVPGFSAIEQTLMACECGAKWIQYRALPKPYDELVETAQIIASICDDWGTTLIINDHVELFGKADIQGVHLGKNDMHPAEARKILGDDLVIGGSSLSIEDAEYFFHNGADYISIGPYHYTETKKTSSEPKGRKGIEEFIEKIYNHITGFDLPIIVAGGIKPDDLNDILQTKAHGIAVSSAINKSEDPKQSFRDFYKKLH